MKTLTTSFSDILKRQLGKQAFIIRIEAIKKSDSSKRIFYFSNDWQEVDNEVADGIISSYGAIKESIDFYKGSFSYGGFDINIQQFQDKINDILADYYFYNRKIEIYYWVEGQEKITNQDIVFNDARLVADSNILDGATDFEIEIENEPTLSDTMQVIAGKDDENYIGLCKNGAVFTVMNNKSVTSDNKTMVFRCDAGRFNFSWNNPTGRLWTFPSGTVIYGTSTPISTSTDEKPDVTIPTGGGFVQLETDSFLGNYQLRSNSSLSTLAIGDLSDLPDLSYFLNLYNLPLIEGNLSDLPDLSYFLYLYNLQLIEGNLSDLPDLSYYLYLNNLPLIEGSLPIPTSTTFRAYKIILVNCENIDIADSIVHMADYWAGKTAPSGAFLDFGSAQAERDVEIEADLLRVAGFEVTYTPH